LFPPHAFSSKTGLLWLKFYTEEINPETLLADARRGGKTKKKNQPEIKLKQVFNALAQRIML